MTSRSGSSIVPLIDTQDAVFVMIIDDSPTVCKILEVCLRRAGYEAMSFGDGVQALQWLNTAEARIPDLIFIDLGLPKMDGYEVIRLLKARPTLAQTVLVILSRRDGILDRIKGRLVGAHAYVTKPFKTQQILTLVQSRLASRESEAPTPSPLATTRW